MRKQNMQIANGKYQRSSKANGLLIFLFVLANCQLPTANCLSQIINNSPSGITLPEPVFNKAFIKNNKIRSVKASVVDKPDGEIIRDKGLAENFRVDTSGNLVRHSYNEITSLAKTEIEIPAVYKRGHVVKKSSTKVNYEYPYDTLGTEYVFTSNGFLKMKR